MARELERQWESALRDLQELEQQYARFRRAHPVTGGSGHMVVITGWAIPGRVEGEGQDAIRLCDRLADPTLQIAT